MWAPFYVSRWCDSLVHKKTVHLKIRRKLKFQCLWRFSCFVGSLKVSWSSWRSERTDCRAAATWLLDWSATNIHRALQSERHCSNSGTLHIHISIFRSFSEGSSTTLPKNNTITLTSSYEIIAMSTQAACCHFQNAPCCKEMKCEELFSLSSYLGRKEDRKKS